MAEAIERLHAQIQEQATTDELTGLFNRRHLLETLHREVARAQRSGEQLAVIMLDIDDLKALNDRLGHAAGDEALRTVADALRDNVRAGDIAARFGGDEFVAVLPACHREELKSVMQRIREQCSAAASADGAPASTRRTVSVGGVLLKPGDSADELLHRADLALYRAKGTGRDRVWLVA